LPASLHPADPCPDRRLLNSEGLGLVEADIVPHAKGGEGSFDIKGFRAWVAKNALASVASDASSYEPYEAGTRVYTLNDLQALSVQAGEVQVI